MNEIKIAAGESKQVRIKATKEGWLDSAIAEYNYSVLEGKVATPAIVPDEVTQGKFTLTCATSGASIRYTIDGSTPSATEGTVYSEAVTLEAPATVKAKAFKAGWADSAVASLEVEVAVWEDPSDMAGIVAWYDMENAGNFTDDGTTATWANKIAGDVDFTAPVATAPTKGSKILTFAAASTQFMTRAKGLLSGTTNFSVALVMKSTGTTEVYQHLVSHNSGAGQHISLMLVSDLTLLRLAGGVSLDATVNAAALQSQYRLYVFNHKFDGDDTVAGYKCGAAGADAGATGNAGATAFGTTNGLILGKHNSNSTNYINAEVKAMIIVNGTITADDLTALKAYCVSTYGVDL